MGAEGMGAEGMGAEGMGAHGMGADRTGTEAEGSCEYLELATGWALHALEPEDEAFFARHLPGCAECAEEVEATEEIALLLAADVEQVDPPEHLRASVLELARGSGTSGGQTSPAPSTSVPGVGPSGSTTPGSPGAHRPVGGPLRGRGATRGGPGRWLGGSRRALLAAAAVLVLGVGVVAGWAGANVFDGSTSTTPTVSAFDQPQVVSALSDPSVRKVALREKDLTGAPMALLLAGDSGTMVVPMNMPGAAANSQYVLWGMNGLGDTSPVMLGPVTTTGAPAGALGVAPMTTSDPTSFPMFAVSVEPAGAQPASPGTIVAIGQVSA